MRISKFLTALGIMLFFQVVACPAAGIDYGDQTNWTQTRYGSTIVIRPAQGNSEHTSPTVEKNVRPERIVGYRSISEFVNALLGFESSCTPHSFHHISPLD